jgi:hypothetical protein
VHRAEAGLGAQGHVLAWKQTIVGQSALIQSEIRFRETLQALATTEY